VVARCFAVVRQQERGGYRLALLSWRREEAMREGMPITG